MRPTPQRVRESLFSVLGDRVEGARVLDLFAGSGALGLECLSRGAASAVFVERDRAVAAVLRQNVESAGAARCQVLVREASSAVRDLGRQGARFDLVFLDPPYGRGLVEPTVEALGAAGLVAPDGLVVVDHPAGEPPGPRIGSLVLVDRRVFGDTAVAMFAPAQGPDEAPSQEHTMARVAIYPGSFDPVTHGHLNIIHRALQVFDRLIVGVLDNASKSALFTVDERIAQIGGALEHDPRVQAVHFGGLLVDFARAHGATVVVRGLRAVSDFDYEFQMAHMNRRLAPEIETMFMMTGEEFFYVSSRLVKEVAFLGGDVTGLVPENVVAALATRYPQNPR